MFKKLLLFFLLLSAPFFADDHFFEIKGFLGHDELKEVNEKIDRLKNTEGGKIIIQLSSSSGDFQEVSYLTQNLFELKANNNKFILVYIQGRAVGPAAIIPFLADEIMISPIAAWGDIPYGVPEDYDREMMQSRVRGMIDENLNRASVLKKLADAMIDPHTQLIFEKGQAVIEHDPSSQNFEPLILNQEGMVSLGLVSRILSDEAFIEEYVPEKKSVGVSGFYPGIISNYVTTEELHKSFKQHLHYNETEENLIGFLEIGPKHSIDQSTYLYIKYALEEFKKKKVRCVILHLNTPGGDVISSLKIVNLLQQIDVEAGIPIIAMIDDWAVSTGAMLAYACRYIAVNPNSLMGAEKPALFNGSRGAETSSERVNAALSSEFSNLASFYGRNPLVAEAMVNKEMILVIRNHQITKLQSEEEINASSRNPDIIITEKGKLLTLNAEQLISLGVASFEVPIGLLPKGKEMGRGKEKWPANQMPVFEEPYLSKIPNAFMIGYKDWRVSFFTALSQPAILALLFMGLVIGFYIEINTPGFGAFGSIGLVCLALILLSGFAVETIHYLEVIILAVGMLLLAIELFVIPGFGIVGIFGIIVTVIGLFAVMLPGVDKLYMFNMDRLSLIVSLFLARLLWLVSGLILSTAIIALLAKFFSHKFFRFSKQAAQGEIIEPLSDKEHEPVAREGDLGETVTPLRPSGKVHIGENIYEAVARTGFIDKHVAIEVVRIEGSKLIVRSIERTPSK